MTHICVSKLTIICSDNGLSPGRRQAIIWTNAGLLLIGPLGTNFSEILIDILTFSFKKMRLKVSCAKRRTFCLGLNVLILTIPLMFSACEGITYNMFSITCRIWNPTMANVWKIDALSWFTQPSVIVTVVMSHAGELLIGSLTYQEIGFLVP